MNRFFPSAERVVEARAVLETGHYGELNSLMGAAELDIPHEGDLKELMAEFCQLARTLELADDEPLGFVVLVSVTVNGVAHTTPVLVDTQYCELSFTSHPDLGAQAISDEIIVGNPHLAAEIREELLGVIATWRNRSEDER